MAPKQTHRRLAVRLYDIVGPGRYLILLACLASALVQPGAAQVSPLIQEQRCFGGSALDFGDAIVSASDGGFVIVGYTNSNDGDIVGAHGGQDAWVAHIDQFGDQVWSVCLGSDQDDWLSSIVPTKDGGYLLGGTTAALTIGSSQNHGKFDAWLVKLDAHGTIQWQREYGGSSYDAFTSLCRYNGEGGGYLAIGYTQSKDGDVTGNHSSDPYHSANKDIWLAHINEGGDIVWQKCFGGDSTETATRIIPLTGGGYAFCGQTCSNEGDVKDSFQRSYYNPDGWVVRIDESGSIIWQRCLGGSTSDVVKSLMQSKDSEIVVLINTNSIDRDVHPRQWDTSTKVSNTLITKLHRDGTINWNLLIGGSFSDEPAKIMQKANGEFILCGSTYSNDGDFLALLHDSLSKKGYVFWDIYVCTISTSGKLMQANCYGGSWSETASDALLLPDNTLAILGTTQSLDHDVVGLHNASVVGVTGPPSDIWFFTVSPELSGVPSSNYLVDMTRADLLKVYPNPSSSQAHFQIENGLQLIKINFYDQLGIDRTQAYSTSDNTAVASTEGLPSGVYLVRVSFLNHGYPGTLALPFVVQH